MAGKPDDLKPQRQERHEKPQAVSTPPSEALRSSERTGSIQLERIRIKIEQTEAELAETLSAIDERLSFDRFRERLEDWFIEATVERAKIMMRNVSGRATGIGQSIVDTARRNPIPLALAGLGLGWLIVDSMRATTDGGYGRRYEPEELEYSSSRIGEPGGEFELAHGGYDAASHLQETPEYFTGASHEEKEEGYRQRAREQAERYTGKAREAASHYRSEAQRRAEEAREKAKYYGSEAQRRAAEAREKAKHYGEEVRHRLSRSTGTLSDMLEDHPLVLGFATFAVGMALGLMVPESRREQEMMGETREELMRKTREAGAEAVERVESVVREAGRAAKEEAEKQELTAEQTTEKMKRVAEEARTAAEEEVRRETPSE